jgi:hypothetical protein
VDFAVEEFGRIFLQDIFFTYLKCPCSTLDFLRQLQRPMESLGMMQEAKVVVALDFGTTSSGFAYALRADPENVYTFYDWPKQAQGGGLPYC